MGAFGRIADRLWRRRLVPVAVPTPAAAPLTPTPLNVTQAALDALRGNPEAAKRQAVSPFAVLQKPPPGVVPRTADGLAMDEAIGAASVGTWSTWASGGLWGEGLYFPGYPYLAELTQRPEYRHIVETIAEQMTRKWIKLNSVGDTDKSEKIEKLDQAMKRYELRTVFYDAAMLDGFMGMGLVYPDLAGVSDNPDELSKPLLRDEKGLLTSAKIGQGKLRGFVVIDPTWVSPQAYNSTEPLKPDFMVPSSWYVMGKRVDATRLMIVRSREMPDILKAAYNFGGQSLSQMAKPYVDNWLRTRQSVSDLLHAFTVFVLKTNMMAYLADASQLALRLSAFILGRDNKGLMMVDKETEELDNVSAPLSGLDALQAQAQEQMASVSQIPVVWLMGVTPTGLNASAADEIRVFYDRVKAKQEKVFRPHLETALQIIQLSEFGEVDPEIGFEFLPLWELDDAGLAAVDKMKADTDAVRIADGVIDNQEARDTLRADPRSPYHGLKKEAPDPPEPMMMVGEEGDDADRIGNRGAEGDEGGANSGV